MEFKNYELKRVTEVLINLYDKAKTVTLKWELANVSAPFIEKSNMLQQEINNIILTEGIEDENGKKEIKTDNQHYLELLNLNTDIKFEMIKLSLLKDVDISIDEMLVLKKLIKEDE